MTTLFVVLATWMGISVIVSLLLGKLFKHAHEHATPRPRWDPPPPLPRDPPAAEQSSDASAERVRPTGPPSPTSAVSPSRQHPSRT